jgi:hypothetical protein
VVEHSYEAPSFNSCEIRETRELLRFSLPDRLLLILVATRHNIGQHEAALLIEAARCVPPEAVDELLQPGNRAALESMVAAYPEWYPSLVASVLARSGEDLGPNTCKQIVHDCHRRLVSVCPQGRDSADAAVRRRGLRIFCRLIESACRAERDRRERLQARDPKRLAAIAAVTAKFDDIYPALVAETTRKFGRRIGREEVKDLIQEAYLKFRPDWPASGTTLPADPTEADRSYGIALLKSAVYDVFIDRHIRELRARYEYQPKVKEGGDATDFAANRDWREAHQPVYQAALLRNLTSKVWPRFCADCKRATADTRDALIESARLFGCPMDADSLLNWCCSYLLNEADLGGLPGPWIKAYLQWRLAITAGTAEIRKFRLKAVLLEIIAAHLSA